MEFKAFGKLNIFLKILSRDERGYHSLVSRFCLVKGIYDDIFIKEADRFGLFGDFSCSIEDNLITKAIKALKNRLPLKEAGLLDYLKIQVDKKIPEGGGLGGGSSNAGNILYHLNKEYFGLPDEMMFEICKEVGADVSFFYSQALSANVSGIGEVIEEFVEPILEFEVFTPDVYCNTREVYNAFDNLSKSDKGCIDYDIKKWEKESSLQILNSYNREELNDLLKPALNLYPTLKGIEQKLGDEWFFSGSGASFFRLKI